MNRRALLTCAAIVAGLTVAGSPGSQAQTYPSEPITLIVAWPAGGGSDISMRLIADALSKQIGVPVVVLNKPGAGGAIGHREIVNAKPDGYTIGMYSSGGIALPYLNAQANTFDELQPIAFFGEDPNALQVSNASGITSLKDYVERARTNPGKIKNGNDQPGGSSYIGAALYEKLLNVKVTKVSYAGFGPTVIGLMGGEVDSATVPVPDTIEQHKAGKLKSSVSPQPNGTSWRPKSRHSASKASMSSSARGGASSVRKASRKTVCAFSKTTSSRR